MLPPSPASWAAAPRLTVQRPGGPGGDLDGGSDATELEVEPWIAPVRLRLRHVDTLHVEIGHLTPAGAEAVENSIAKRRLVVEHRAEPSRIRGRLRDEEHFDPVEGKDVTAAARGLGIGNDDRPLGLAAFGAVCVVLPVTAIAGLLSAPGSEASSLLAIVFAGAFIVPVMVFGVVFILLALYMAANSFSVEVSASEIRTERRVFGIASAAAAMRCTDIAAIEQQPDRRHEREHENEGGHDPDAHLPIKAQRRDHRLDEPAHRRVPDRSGRDQNQRALESAGELFDLGVSVGVFLVGGSRSDDQCDQGDAGGDEVHHRFQGVREKANGAGDPVRESLQRDRQQRRGNGDDGVPPEVRVLSACGLGRRHSRCHVVHRSAGTESAARNRAAASSTRTATAAASSVRTSPSRYTTLPRTAESTTSEPRAEWKSAATGS